jgi:hypothetical protein
MILQTNLQKERPLRGDLSSVNQVFNMTTIMSGNFFNMNCDVVDYSTAHILSYLIAYLSISVAPIVWISLVVLQPSLLIYWGFFAAPL